MGRCSACGDPMNDPTYTDGESGFCSLKCWKMSQRASDLPNWEDANP